MRTFYCFVVTTDNQFFSCSVQSAQVDPSNEWLCELAMREFARRGNPLPPAYMVRRMRFVQDPRNDPDAGGFEPFEGESGESYAVYSEYEAGVTITH